VSNLKFIFNLDEKTNNSFIVKNFSEEKMKKNILYFIMLVCAVTLFAEGFSIKSPIGNFELDVNSKVEQKKMDQTSIPVVEKIAFKLELLENDYIAKLSKLDQKRAQIIINSIYEMLALLPNDTYIATEVQTEQVNGGNIDISININEQEVEQIDFEEPETVVEQAQIITISENNFQLLCTNIQSESFDDDKLAIIQIVIRSHHFTINQLIRLLALFTFENDKISVVQIVYPKVIDTQNAFNLLNSFTYSSDKKRVQQIIQ
jgi:hypothetical protein